MAVKVAISGFGRIGRNVLRAAAEAKRTDLQFVAINDLVPTKDNAYEYLVDLGVKLDENNVPTTGRFTIVPAWFHGLLLKDDRFVRSGTTTGDQRLMNGEVGEAAGFTILKSNNVPNTTGTKYKIIAGHRMATAYVEQILDVQTYKPEKRFGDAVKGLHVYGAKVVRPTALACLIANKS